MKISASCMSEWSRCDVDVLVVHVLRDRPGFARLALLERVLGGPWQEGGVAEALDVAGEDRGAELRSPKMPAERSFASRIGSAGRSAWTSSAACAHRHVGAH
jgi:hypothetical protein